VSVCDFCFFWVGWFDEESQEELVGFSLTSGVVTSSGLLIQTIELQKLLVGGLGSESLH